MLKILIVDDEKPARDYIAELVAFYIPDVKVIHAENARNALNSLRVENFDLLFVDIDFGAGRMTGLELLEEINRMKKCIFTVIISAHYNFEYAVKGMELGASRYIPKPLDDNLPEIQKKNSIHYIDKPLYKEKIYEAIQLYLHSAQIDMIDLKALDGIHRIHVSQLIAIESFDRNKMKIYTVDAILSGIYCSLNQLYQQLSSNFCYIQRNCIININEIKRYNLKSREVFIACQNKEYSFNVSRNKMKELVALLHPKNIKKDEK